ncbi:uncharacterized protein LOC132544519 [Ylistrum balloti]|uniref:uncharacterized protein LOC132544519 n=1 Tax=Ylistrum balloti TaxID=509963 RepID=UPI002905C149|nr:uncharacterized protein LOC132544519 [Ylistrum balloti]XP_060064108.1 uncharacterized protein LOC132544519 [Ylistrum balloti]XP_060064109.1 uncharacterized protein LOC132544519 [Ylistrum balloti]XP_060064110.1 uncharacterized protein LOC132544519 [Ylistrum balloti]XP_060064111.1 uncharacterized protein LOC132544519 [Ylistrum balloti]XP_060064112.1 uncharacterized protein LOC132544519 [Ylistrum balloti]
MTSSWAIWICLSWCLPHVFCFVPCNNASMPGYCFDGWHCCDNGWCCSDDFVCGDNRCIYLKGLYVPIGIVVVSLCGGICVCIHQFRKRNKFEGAQRMKKTSKEKLQDPEDIINEHF